MKVVYSYAAKYKWLIVVALFFMFIELIIELIQPLFIQEVIDNGILSNDINIEGEDRFKGKKVLRMGVSDLIEKSDAIISKIKKHFK